MFASLATIAATPPTPSARPLALSDVALHGDFADRQSRDRDVLLSLNATRWACHFTTTANLTSCKSAAVPWHTYVKNASAPTGFVHELGFLGAGDDLAPPATVLFPECEARCANAGACLGFCFESTSEQPGGKIKCYLKTAVHFTPLHRSANCLTNGSATAPSCEPLPGEMGLGGYYGHYQGHWLSATAYLINATGDAAVKAAAEANVATLAKVMAAWKQKYGYDGYLFPYDPLVWDKLLSGHGAGPYYSVPFYTLHKLMAGLLAQHLYAGSALAYTMVTKMADWVAMRVNATLAAGGEALWQKVLLTEWGGMNDVLYELYSISGDPSHLATGRRFNAYVFTAPLAAGVDDLATQPFPHANFHLPEIIGNARAYELTGNTTDANIADAFFGALAANHTYVTGGSSSGECWQAPRDLGNFLSSQTQESCTTYNALKVSRHRFLRSAMASDADFYERALWNGIIGNQWRTTAPGSGAETTSYIYMLPLGGGPVKKGWGASDYGFPCCWGTLSESFAKLGDSLFFGAADGALVVNQYVSASAKWRGAVVTQTATFPEHPTATATLTVTPEAGGRNDWPIRVRVPGWLEAGTGSVSLNGKALPGPLTPSSYVDVEPNVGGWKVTDKIYLTFPPPLRVEAINDRHPEYNATLAFLYGPLVLAAVHMPTDIWVPHGNKFRTDASSFIKRNGTDATLTFEATAANGSKILMLPLRDVTDETYVVHLMTAGTRPTQPKFGYCPHSDLTRPGGAPWEKEKDDGDNELINGDPDPPSAPAAADTHVVRSRGVHWTIGAEGQMRARAAA